jgi:uncharacterized protein (TIGR02453 family)
VVGAIVADPKGWKRARDDKKFAALYGELGGDSLKRPPRGFDPDHPLVEDLKRKDFVGFHELKPAALTKPAFLGDVVTSYRTAKPLVTFLCDALDLPF